MSEKETVLKEGKGGSWWGDGGRRTGQTNREGMKILNVYGNKISKADRTARERGDGDGDEDGDGKKKRKKEGERGKEMEKERAVRKHARNGKGEGERRRGKGKGKRLNFQIRNPILQSPPNFLSRRY